MNAIEIANGLREVADWLERNAEDADQIGSLSPPSFYWFTNDRDEFARAVKILGRGAKSKDDNYFNVDRYFGPIHVQATAPREAVCERVVHGTREVTKTVRDPELLESVPLVEVTETVEDVEWVCPPSLLAVDEAAA